MVRHLCKAHAENGGHKRGNAAPPTEGAHTLTRRDFPDAWGLAELRDLVQPSAPITYGILKPGPDRDGGILYVRVADFPNDLLNITRMRRTSTKIDAEFKRSRLKAGDILLSIRGTVGRICSIPQALDGANITQDSARVRLQEVLVPAYIEWMLRSPALQKAMQLAIKGVAVRGINIGDVRALQIPIPSSEEQHEIVKRISVAFDRINRLSKVETARASSLLDRLDHATLAKAFRGELTGANSGRAHVVG
jgi:type I restriction enzyme, S subunit